MASFAKRNACCVVSACLLPALIANVYLVLFSGSNRNLSKVLSSFVKTPRKQEHKEKRPGDGVTMRRMRELEGEVSDIRESVSDLWQSISEVRAHEASPRRDVIEQEPRQSVPTRFDKEENELAQPLSKRTEEASQDYYISQSSSISSTSGPKKFTCPAPEILASTASQSVIPDPDLAATQCGTPVSRGYLFHNLTLALVAEGAGLSTAQAGEVAHATIHACPVAGDRDILEDCKRLTLWGKLKGPDYVFNATISAQHSSSECQWEVTYVVPHYPNVSDERTYELQLVNTWYGGSTGPNTASCNEAVDANWLPPIGISDMSSLEISYRDGPKYLGKIELRRMNILSSVLSSEACVPLSSVKLLSRYFVIYTPFNR